LNYVAHQAPFGSVMPMQPLKPHWAWFLLAPLSAFAGVVGAIVFVVLGVADIANERQTIPVPGSGYVTIEQAGPVLISFEETGAAPARVPPGLFLSIRPESGSESLPLSTPRATYTYHFAGVAGRSFATANVPAPGLYRVSAALPPGESPPPGAAISVGRGPAGAMLGMVLGAFASAGGGVVLAIIVAIVVAVKRSNYRRRLTAGPYPQGVGF
jgi:hypothetical protein